MKLKFALVLFAQLLHISPVISARTVKAIIPESPFIAKEGENKQLHCILEASEAPPPGPYGNIFACTKPVCEIVKTGKNITVSREKKGLQAITTAKFHPLSINDVGDRGFYCTDKPYAADTHVASFILPKSGVPKINFTSTIPKVSGSEVVLNCEAELESAAVNIYLTWLHYKWNASFSEVVAPKEKPERGGKPPKKTIKSVLKVILDQKTAGVYSCVVTAKVKNSVDFNYTRNATVTYSAPVKIVDGVQAKQRLQVYAKKEAVMTCQAVAVPPATVTWKKGNSPIEASSDSRYRFSNYKSTEFGKFVIKDVDYKDRAVYSCNASNSISFVTMEFTLRVRDPLGALWPFIGILIEAIVLAAIIFVHEYYKKKNKAKKARANRKHDKRSKELIGPGPGSDRLNGHEGVTTTTNNELDRRNDKGSTEKQIIDYGTGSGDLKPGILDTHIDDAGVFEVENKQSPEVVLTDPAEALEEGPNMKSDSHAAIGSRIDVLPAKDGLTNTSSIDSETVASGHEMETIGNMSTAKDDSDSYVMTGL